MINIDWDDEKNLDPTSKISSSLYRWIKRLYMYTTKVFADQKKYIANYETVELDTSHWTMEEKPNEANQAVEKWIKRITESQK